MLKEGLRFSLNIVNRVLIPPSYVLRNAGVIILFHSNSARRHRSLEGLGVCNSSPQRILKLIGILRQHYRILSFEEFADCAHRGKSLRGSALITFDDGFKSVYQDLYGPMKETRTPFIIFINSSLCENTRLSWMQKLSLIIQKHKLGQLLEALRSRGWRGCDKIPIINVSSFSEVRVPFIHFYDLHIYNDVFDLFLKELGISEEDEACKANLYLSRDDLWEMRDLCTPGNHTHSHSNVANLKCEHLNNEFSKCNDFINDIGLNRPIPFSIPFGPKSYLTSAVQNVTHKSSQFIFSAYGFGNFRGRQLHFRRFNGDDLRIRTFDDIIHFVTGINYTSQYLLEWMNIIAGR